MLRSVGVPVPVVVPISVLRERLGARSLRFALKVNVNVDVTMDGKRRNKVR